MSAHPLNHPLNHHNVASHPIRRTLAKIIVKQRRRNHFMQSISKLFIFLGLYISCQVNLAETLNENKQSLSI